MSAWGAGGLAKSCNSLLTKVEDNDSSLVDLVILPSKTFGETEVNRISAAVESGTNKHLKSLSASGHSIPPSSLVRLGRAISAPPSTISRLAIGDRQLGNEGVVALCSSLESAHGGSLESLDLEWKGLSVDAMGALGHCFGPSPRLRHLNLSRNNLIGDEGIAELCNCAASRATALPFSRLEYLDLSECGIGHVGVSAAAQCLKPEDYSSPPSNGKRVFMMELKLNSNPLGPTGCQPLSKLLCGTPVLKSLSISRCNIGDEGIELLYNALSEASCEGLNKLDMSHNGIGPKGAAALAQSFWCNGNSHWTSLSHLCLAGNKLGEAGVMSLSRSLMRKESRESTNESEGDAPNGNAIIHELDLSQTCCGIEGATSIVQCSSLSSVRLFNNGLGSAGFQALSTVLRGGHCSIETLDLGGNNADHVAVVELLQALTEKTQVDSKLQVLELGGNGSGDEVEEAIRKLQVVQPNLDIARDRPRKR